MKRTLVALCCLVVLALVGCGPKLPDGMPKLYPTAVTITSGGQPVADAPVQAFLDGFTWPINGVTDANGRAELMVQGQYPGAPAGDLVVTVRKLRVVDGPTKQAQPEPPADYNEHLEWGAAVQAEEEQFLLGGEEYSDPQKSPLKITVTKGKNDLVLEIPSDEVQIKFAK